MVADPRRRSLRDLSSRGPRVRGSHHGRLQADEAFFARGDNFPDALAVGPVAAGAYAPVLLVRSTSVPPAIADVVDDFDVTYGFIIGGTNVVSSGVQGTLESLMAANGADPHPIERWAGATRYETAISVVEHGLENRWIDLDTLGVATGQNFPMRWAAVRRWRATGAL